MNTRKLFFFCNDRLPFLNETMYSKGTENCLYSHLLGKQRWVWWVKRDLWTKAVPVSRGRFLEIQTKTIFYCSYIQCNSLLYLLTFQFLCATLQQTNLQVNWWIVSDFYLRPPYLSTSFHQPLLEMYSASVPMCNVAALTFMQLFMKICVVVVFLKKGMYVPGTAIDVCIVLTLA